MKIFRLNEYARMPEFATKGSACFDLNSCLTKDTKIKTFTPHNKEVIVPVRVGKDGEASFQLHTQFRVLIPTGLIFDIPEKHVLKVFPRSGMAIKYGLTLVNNVGIIDSDYVEELFISIINVSDTTVTIYNNDRLAQARLEKDVVTKLEEVLERPTRKTEREGGFGSTGTN
jgi:dUTP pyrophosphatase